MGACSLPKYPTTTATKAGAMGGGGAGKRGLTCWEEAPENTVWGEGRGGRQMIRGCSRAMHIDATVGTLAALDAALFG